MGAPCVRGDCLRAFRSRIFFLGRAFSLTAAASDQVVYQDDYSDDQQDMNQAATDVTEESEQPQDQQDH